METYSKLDLRKYNPVAIINALIATAHYTKAAIAVWVLPDSVKKTLIVSLTPTDNETDISCLIERQGFILSPFKPVNGKAMSAFVAADGILESHEGKCFFTWRTNVNPEKTAHFETVLQRLLRSGELAWHALTNPPPLSSTQKPCFISMVEKALQEIRRKNLLKVVLARRLVYTLLGNFSPSTAYHALVEHYPEAFVYLVSTPQSGTWMGASPESLIAKDRRRSILSTVALAATKADRDGADIACWGAKEIHEHQLVSSYIEKTLQAMGVGQYHKGPLQPHRAGHLYHLKETFSVSLKCYANRHVTTGNLLHALHPTPAVCGLPKRAALDFIDAEEGCRALFAGFLGPVNFNDELQLYVNIRCMQVQQNKAILYAGAGITHDSNPEAEWAETEGKCQTLASILKEQLQCLA